MLRGKAVIGIVNFRTAFPEHELKFTEQMLQRYNDIITHGSNVAMIEVQELGNKQIEELLKRVGYGHLGCARNNHPYVVPINYAYEDGLIYIYTTEGKKRR